MKLDYYAKHKDLLSQGGYRRLGTTDRVEAFQKHSSIPLPDFLNYFLIHRDKSEAYATYVQRLKHLDAAAAWIDGVVSTSGTINWMPGADNLQETIGEAVSLSVAGQLFGLTEADWTRIPEQKGVGALKTFDFEHTLMGVTDGDAVIQVEAKGTFVKDNSKYQANVSTHARNISQKKEIIRGAGDEYEHPAAALYGMIVAVDPTNVTKCWLLDPPALPFVGEPHNLKVASRLDNVASITEMLVPHGKLPYALRLSAADWRGGEGSSSTIQEFPFYTDSYVEHYLARNKVWLAEQDVAGELFIGIKGKPFFLGVQGDLIRTAASQNDGEIARLHFSPSVKPVTITAEPRQIYSWSKASKRSVKLNLFRSSSGVVIGLPVTSNWLLLC